MFMMKTSEEIRTEPDPFLREIWAMGYDFIYEDFCSDTISLCRKSDGYQKRIPRRGDYFYLKIIRGVLPDGTIHAWLSEADGSADKFRELIKPLNITEE